MLSWVITKKITAFEKDFDFYDASYLKDLLAISPRALVAFYKATNVANYRESLPISAAYCAKIVGTMHEDCGPCTQLVVTMAEREGVSPEVLQALIQKRHDDLPEMLSHVAMFCEAVLLRDTSADAHRQKIIGEFGKKGLVSIAFALLSARLYPTLKYALGYGKKCSLIHLAGTSHRASKEVA